MGRSCERRPVARVCTGLFCFYSPGFDHTKDLFLKFFFKKIDNKKCNILQLYAFQPDSNGQDLRGLIPAPRRSTAGMAGLPVGHPGQFGGMGEAQREQDRHRQIAQHLNSQLGGGSPVAAYPGTPKMQQYPGSPASPSQHSPIQGNEAGPFRGGIMGAPVGAPGLPGINPMQAEIDSQREQERHRLIAQHLNQQLSHDAPQQPHGTWAQTPPHAVAHHPAPSPMHPSPVNFMPSPVNFPGSPVVHNPHNSPVTPMIGGNRADLPGTDPHQNQLDQQQEAERHRQISEHLQRQLGSGAAQSPHVGVGVPQSPMYASPMQHGGYSQPTAVPPPQSNAGGLPGVDPRQAEIDSRREEERHRLISQHLNQQLSGGGAGSVGGIGGGGGGGGAHMMTSPPMSGPAYAVSPPQYGGGAGAGGGAHFSQIGGPSETDKEAERHRLVAQHLNSTLASRQ